MKKLFGLMAGAALLVALTSCTSNPLSATFLSLTTNFYNGNNANPVYFICDNKVTTITYSFSYNDFSFFDGWASQLRGFADPSKTAGLVSFPRDDVRNNTSTRTVSVTYEVQAAAAPLRIHSPTASTQAIVVTPVPSPSIIGKTYVEILVRGRNGGSDLSGRFGPISVIDNCP